MDAQAPGGAERSGEALPITHLLERWCQGDRSSEDELFAAVHSELTLIAERLMRHERPGHTIDPASLVSEAYLRLRTSDLICVDRVHFYAVAARVMRRFLIDYARARRADKRGGGAVVTLQTDLQGAGAAPLSVRRFEQALSALERLDPRKAEFVVLRHLTGLSNAEIAAGANVSERSVRRDLSYARAFIRREIAL